MPFVPSRLMLAASAATLCAFAQPPTTVYPSTSSASSPPDLAAAAAGLRAATAAVKVRTRAMDGFALDVSAGAPAILGAQWAAVRRWTALWLDHNPRADARALAAAARRDAGLDVSMIDLGGGAALISADADAFGTAFILGRGPDGRRTTALAMDRSDSWGGGGPAVLAAWRSDRATGDCRGPGGAPVPRLDCGPLSARLARLPDEADGARRFALVGRYVKSMGATDGYQLSVWRWTGRVAQPLQAYTLAQMADDPVIARVGRAALIVHEKAEWTRLSACGACSGRQVEVRFALPARGVALAGKRSLTPDLDRVDVLYDRLFGSQPASDLAAPPVLAALAPTVEALRATAHAARLDPSLGLLLRWKLTRRGGVSTLCLATDALDNAQVFTLDARAVPRITAVRSAPAQACDGAGSQA